MFFLYQVTWAISHGQRSLFELFVVCAGEEREQNAREVSPGLWKGEVWKVNQSLEGIYPRQYNC
jgi:hypothetical protein